MLKTSLYFFIAICFFNSACLSQNAPTYTKFRPVTLEFGGNLQLNAETSDELSKTHPKNVSLFISYSVFKEGNVGLFGSGAYSGGYWFGVGGLKTEFELREGLIGEERGDLIAHVAFALGTGVRTKATGKDRLMWFFKASAKNPKWELDGALFGSLKDVSFSIRCGMYAWKILRIGLEGQKYAGSTSVAGLFAEGIIPFEKHVVAKIGGSIGAQVQNQMRFHWVPGIHASVSAHF